MKRFSVLLVLLFCLGFIITNFNAADFSPTNVAKDAYSNGLSMTRTVDYRIYMN